MECGMGDKGDNTLTNKAIKMGTILKTVSLLSYMSVIAGL
jgi:hypothetical protein